MYLFLWKGHSASPYIIIAWHCLTGKKYYILMQSASQYIIFVGKFLVKKKYLFNFDKKGILQTHTSSIFGIV